MLIKIIIKNHKNANTESNICKTIYNHTVTLYPKLKCHFAKIQQDCTTNTDLYTQIKLKSLDIIQQNVQ